MAVRHKGSMSEHFEMPGGGPQGTNLGILAYLVNINSCGVSLESLTDYLQETFNEAEIYHPILPLPPPHLTEDNARFKYIDDVSLCHAIDLKHVKSTEANLPKPVNFRDWGVFCA